MRGFWAYLLCVVAAASAGAQTPFTITRTDAATPLLAKAKKAGLNKGTTLKVDGSNEYRNILCAVNCGFEKTISRQIYAAPMTGSKTSIVEPPYYTNANATYAANSYQNAKVEILSVPNHLNSAMPSSWTGTEKGCTAIVASNPPYGGLANVATTDSFAIASGVLTVQAENNFVAGEVVTFANMDAATYLNSTMAAPIYFTIASRTASQFTVATGHADVASTTETAGQVTPAAVLNLSGFTKNGASVTDCGEPTVAGDVFRIEMPITATPESFWEAQGYIGPGASLTSDTSTPHAGSQAMIVNTTPAGSDSNFTFYLDDDTHNVWHLMKTGTTWQAGGWLKRISGANNVTVSIGRANNGADFCTHAFTPTSTSWAFYTFACSPTEGASTVPGLLHFQLTFSAGGSVDVDDADLERTDTRNSANTTPWSDESYRRDCYYNGGCDSVVWGYIRPWETQHADPLANYSLPLGQKALSAIGDPFNPSEYEIVNNAGLPDIEALAVLEHSALYMPAPIIFDDAEDSGLIDQLMTVQSGQTAAWTGPGGQLPEVDISIGNEAWNGSTPGSSLPYRSGDNTQYQDYINRACDAILAMRANPHFNATYIKLGFNVQGANISGVTDENGSGTDWYYMVHHGCAPDYFDYAGYSQASVSDFDTEYDQWAGALEEPWDVFNNTGNLDQGHIAALVALNQCGVSGTATCHMTTYEWADGTQNTCGGFYVSTCGGIHNQAITQSALTQMGAGAGQGIVAPAEAAIRMRHGWFSNNYFAANGYGGTVSIGFNHIWHNTIDAGGSCSFANQATWNGFCPTPSATGMSVFNRAVLGDLVPCASSAGTHAFAGSNNGPLTAASGVPNLDITCFADAARSLYSVVIVNTDQTNTYTLNSIAGTNPPAAGITVTAFEPASLNLTNETLGAGSTAAFVPQTGAPVVTTQSTFSALTVKPHAVYAVVYSNAASLPAAVTASPFVLVNGVVRLIAH